MPPLPAFRDTESYYATLAHDEAMRQGGRLLPPTGTGKAVSGS